MGILNDNQIMGASAAGGDYEIEQSLRFDKGSTPYLNRTFAAVGNRKTWTFSAWVKRAGLTDGTKTIFCSYAANNDAGYFDISFLAADTIGVHTWGTTFRVSNQLFRDTGAWYHVVLSVDTTQGTASNRLKVYVNGDEITSWSTNNAPSQNFDTAINNDKIHSVGALSSTAAFVDGYLAEVNFIDGQALTPDSFGETGDYGEWKPTKYAGTYGTNGFYLPFEQDYTVEGFSTVTYEGNGTSGHYIGGTGFEPSLVWLKQRSNNNSHALVDQVRGVLKGLSSDSTAAENTFNHVKSFESDGFTVGTSAQANSNNATYVAWNWDMGGTTASNTSGSITSSVRANTTYGQSIVGYTGNGTAGATVGHGLASAPTMVIVKSRTVDGKHWATYHVDLGNTVRIDLESSGAKITGTGAWNSTTPTSSLVTLGSQSDVNTSSATHIMYAFHDVTGYSKFGSYSGNGSSTGPVVTLGFSPAFVMIKRTDAANNWLMYDNTRSPNNPNGHILFANLSDAESVETANNIVDFDSNGFTLKSNSAATNASGGTYIYMAFADTREYAYWYDQSGNNNDWTSEGGLTESDVMLDSPTNNFCTLNPLAMGSGVTLSEGNLSSVSSSWQWAKSTYGVGSGKWYWEVNHLNGGADNLFCGISKESFTAFGYNLATASAENYNVWGYTSNLGYKEGQNTYASYGAVFQTAGDVVGVALDMDAGTIAFYKNGASQGTAFSNVTGVVNPVWGGVNSSVSEGIMNFGADSSFAGNKTPQGNSDANGIGDFYYAPPSGFLALCTANLPEPDVIPSENFNPVLYTGNQAANVAVTGVGFEPSLVWGKNRSSASNHWLFDSVRGTTKMLQADQNNAEETQSGVTAFGSDGFTLGTWIGSTKTGDDYVAWNWKAEGSASTNTSGSIDSSVLANTAAGFSIASFTCPSGSGLYTVGHGLGAVPEFMIVKGRSATGNWHIYHKDVGNTKAYFLNNSTAGFTSTGYWGDTTPTSTVFTQSIGGTLDVGTTAIGYFFNSVDGYSKVGSYTGNGSADGPFVHCGFRPAFVMVKRTDAGGGWHILDNKRASPFNEIEVRIEADNSDAENTGGPPDTDLVSNGFKLRTTFDNMNASGGTYIFLAFAESPFKNSNAR